MRSSQNSYSTTLVNKALRKLSELSFRNDNLSLAREVGVTTPT
jgi:hypothetical protein